MWTPGHRCQGEPSIVDQPGGFLASVVTDDSGCGGTQSPWILNAQPGQRINLTLIDFSTLSPGNGSVSPRYKDNQFCRVLFTVKDEATSRSVNVCGGDSRKKHGHLSLGHQVEIRILGGQNQENQVYFLIQFDGKTTKGFETSYCNTY